MRKGKQIIEDYKKPTDPKWRKRGDFALIMAIALQTLIATAPEEVLSTKQSYWLAGAITLVTTAYKFWTNTHAKEDENT